MPLDLATPDPLRAPDWALLGHVLAIVGCFLLANGVLFRNPRNLVAERLGRAAQPLRGIREFVFHRVQMTLGFLFLVCAFAAQLLGRVRPPPADGESGSAVMWVGLAIVLAVVLEVVGWWWSLYSLRGHVRAYLRDNPPDFDTDIGLAREIGELFGVESRADETVQSYAARLRKSLGVAPAQRGVQGERRPLGPQRAYGEEIDPGLEDT